MTATPVSITFQSKTQLAEALLPLPLEEVIARISSASPETRLDFHYDKTLELKKVIPLRNPGIGNLLNTALYKTNTLTVFFPATPRVPHHLAIALNREINGISEMNQ